MAMSQAYKNEWQRKARSEFQKKHGFSTASNYSNNKIRLEILERDNYSCVACGMTDEQHKARWGRPITVDHKDRNRKNNTHENLQTLCLSCHGRKDQSWYLKLAKAPIYKAEILAMRAEGKSYKNIAHALDLSIGTIWKWTQRWEGENK